MVLQAAELLFRELNRSEARAIAAALLGVSLALSPKFGTYGIASVLVGFIVHEMAHRQTARSLGCSSRFILDPMGYGLTLVSTLFPIAFLAPGYVGVSCWGVMIGPRESLKISASGPATNIVMALAAVTALKLGLVHPFLYVFAVINSWLALFNLIPLGPLDGAKILRASPPTWIFMAIVSAGLFFAL